MTLSVIIPALNEAEHIGGAVETVRRAKPHEVIVVDGGSSDRTAELASRAGATVLTSSPSRGLQQRLGAERAANGSSSSTPIRGSPRIIPRSSPGS